jgi:choline dehydrogenase-like flavoprotein
MAREVTTDAEGVATGVAYVDTATGRDRHVRARVVVLAASACESARLLLNSRSSRHPNGLANSSGCVGRYLTDSVGTSVGGFVPSLVDLPPHNCDGVGGMHVYIPWWLDNRKLDFPRGYHVEIGGGRHMPGYGFGTGIEQVQGGGYGKALKDDYRRFYGAFVSFSGRGEMIPNEKSYCEIDPEVVDRWGIPVLRFHWEWSEHDLAQARHMRKTFAGIVEAMGGRVVERNRTLRARSVAPTEDGISIGGEIIHEAGTTRMGASSRTSVLNTWCQAHDAKNLFVADAGPFVTNAHKNCTWTILALAMRTAERIADERGRGNL